MIGAMLALIRPAERPSKTSVSRKGGSDVPEVMTTGSAAQILAAWARPASNAPKAMERNRPHLVSARYPPSCHQSSLTTLLLLSALTHQRARKREHRERRRQRRAHSQTQTHGARRISLLHGSSSRGSRRQWSLHKVGEHAAGAIVAGSLCELDERQGECRPGNGRCYPPQAETLGLGEGGLIVVCRACCREAGDWASASTPGEE